MRVMVSLTAALALTACGGDGAGGNATASAPVAAVGAPAGKNWTETVVKTPEGGHQVGNPDAALKLIEYGSRTCPTCGLFGREGMPKLMEQYVATGKVSFEFRDFMVHGAPDLAAALLGTCVPAQTFVPVLEAMYQNQQAYLEKLEKAGEPFQRGLQGKPPTEIASAWAQQMGLIDFVKQRGLPETQARACLADNARIDALVKVTEAGSASGKVTGTPTFLLNGERVEAATWEQLEPALKAAGA